MTATLGGSVELLERALGYTRARLGRVDDGLLDRPTPCEGWTLGDLLAHMEDALDAFTEAASGRVRVDAVPETHTQEYQETVMVPYWKEEERQQTVSVPYTRQETRQRTVVHTEWRTEKRERSVWVPETTSRPSNVDGSVPAVE